MSLLRTIDSDEIVLHRLFFALKPEENVLALLRNERGRTGVARAHEADERINLTLWALDLPCSPTPGTIARLGEAAARVRGTPMRILLQQVQSDGCRTALIPGEPVPVLRAFQQRLQLAIAEAGLWPNRGFRFEPEVVLALGQERRFRQAVPTPISWRASEFVLVHSLVGLTEDIELGCWRLDH